MLKLHPSVEKKLKTSSKLGEPDNVKWVMCGN